MVGVGIGTLAVYVLLFISLYFEVFMLVSVLDRRRDMAEQDTTPEPVDPASLPTVAVVIPCWNEERTVAGTIESLLALDYPKEKLSIIVVDDGSKDNTLAIAKPFAETDPRVKVFTKENGGKHSAMNYALAHTDAEIIGCLDADSSVSPDALMHIIPSFSDPAIAAVTPGIHVRAPETLLQHMQDAEYRLSLFNRYALASLGSMFITPGPFSFFRATVVREMGGWRHAHATEDLELAIRLQLAGHLIANAPAAAVHTASPRTVRTLFRQRVRWTYGFLRNMIDYRFMLGNSTYGNLGLVILPTAIISIGAGIFFFLRMGWFAIERIMHEITRVEIVGISTSYPSFSLFYVNTSMMIFLVIMSMSLIITLISMGTWLGTQHKMPPKGTVVFLAFYSFLVPLWLTASVIRAIFNTGVRWR